MSYTVKDVYTIVAHTVIYGDTVLFFSYVQHVLFAKFSKTRFSN